MANFENLVATFRHEVASFTDDPDKQMSGLWSALRELDRECDERTLTEPEIAELSAAVGELRQSAMHCARLKPVLIDSLETLIWSYWDEHQYEKVIPLAEERVILVRSLADANSDIWAKVRHRKSIDTLGRALFLLGRNHQALPVVEEAVAMARDHLAAGWTASTELRRQLSLLCSCLTALDRHEDAVIAAEEMVSIETKLRLVDATRDPLRLAEALSNLARCLHTLGRYSAAATAMQEAVALYRQSAADGELNARYDLAYALHWLGYCLEDASRIPEAIAAHREDIALRRELPIRDGHADAGDFAFSLKTLVCHLRRQNRQAAEWMPIAQEAVARYRALAIAGQLEPRQMWQEFQPTATLVREQLTEAGRYPEAIADAREQVEACRQLAAARPDLHNLGLTEALIDLADLLSLAGHPMKAAKARAEAQAIKP